MTGLSLGRIAAGAAALSKPEVAAGVLGVDSVTNPQASYVTRLFGVREVALGAATLLTTGTARRNLVLVGIAVDLADATVAVLGIRDRSVPSRAGIALLGPAAGAVLSGVRSLRAARR